MEEEQKDSTAPEASENNAPKEDDSAVTPTEPKEEAEKIKEDVDPRVINIVGEDAIDSAFGKQEEEQEEDQANDEKQVKKEPAKKEGDQEEVKEKETEIENMEVKTSKPSRLDKRLVQHYVRNLHLSGEKNIPSEEQLFAELQDYSQEEKIEAMHRHRLKGKELAGESPSDDELEEEDLEAIEDAKREEIRQEVYAEQEQRMQEQNFIDFMESHPELTEESKDYDPNLAEAVETLWENGMSIDKAYKTVTDKIEAVKQAQLKEQQKEKNSALSGALSGTGKTSSDTGKLTWEDAEKIQEEDPHRYTQMVKEGKFKHLS